MDNLNNTDIIKDNLRSMALIKLEMVQKNSIGREEVNRLIKSIKYDKQCIKKQVKNDKHVLPNNDVVDADDVGVDAGSVEKKNKPESNPKIIKETDGEPELEKVIVKSHELLKKVSIRYVKNVKLLLSALTSLIQYKILLIDDASYQQTHDKNFSFPNSVDKLIILMGYYCNAFDTNMEQLCYDLVSLDCYQSLFSMTQVRFEIYDITQDVNNIAVIEDYYKFEEIAIDILCVGFNIDIELNDSIIETA